MPCIPLLLCHPSQIPIAAAKRIVVCNTALKPLFRFLMVSTLHAGIADFKAVVFPPVALTLEVFFLCLLPLLQLIIGISQITIHMIGPWSVLHDFLQQINGILISSNLVVVICDIAVGITIPVADLCCSPVPE